MAYQISPPPQSGNGAFGRVPGQISAPPSIWEQLNSNIPNYGALTTSATGNIQNELNGTLSPSTMTAIGNRAAAHGVSTGQPNSAMSNLFGYSLTGNTVEGLQHQGVTDYNNLTGTLGSTQQNPALVSSIAETNAVNNSAPDPGAAAAYYKQLFDSYMNPAGGTGRYSSTDFGSMYGRNPYAGMGFHSQDGGASGSGAGAQGGFRTGIGPVISTGADWYSQPTYGGN
jgi:hypothetical protein